MRYNKPIIILFTLGCLLRLMLFIANDYRIAYDDHTEHIHYIVKYRSIPPAESSWEAFQPPFYYILSALVFYLTEPLTGYGWKYVQMLSFLSGILTLYIYYHIIKKIFFRQPIIQLFSLGFLAFLPRHIYMSAMLTNDSLLYLVIALTIFVLIKCIETGCKMRYLITLAVMGGLCALTKISGLLILPVIIISLAFTLPRLHNYSPLKTTGLICSIILISVVIGSYKYVDNSQRYGNPFVSNHRFFSQGEDLPPGSLDKVSFFSFKIKQLIQVPIINKRHLDSFFTELYGRLWFDYEPRFVNPHNPSTWREGHIIVILALLPTFTLLYGFDVALKNMRHNYYYLISALLFICALLSPLLLTFVRPCFSAMKAAYLLIGLPSLSILFGLGLQKFVSLVWLRKLFTVNCLLLALYITIHLCRISYLGWTSLMQ